MRLYPAIDLKDGKCVRLVQGDYGKVTVFHDNPVEVAQKWEAEGAQYLHLVDLDGAKAGEEMNREVIKAIVESVQIPVQLGGGIRTLAAIQKALAIGISRVILGSIAVKDKGFVEEAIRCFGSERIVIGVDAKEGKVAIHGWEDVTTLGALDFCQEMAEIGVQTVIYTDIAKDGMMKGPNLAETEAIVKATKLQVILSGGVSTVEDLLAARAIGVEGSILGKALYTQAISLGNAIAVLEEGGC